MTPLVIEEAVPLDPELVVQQDGSRDSGETKSGDETKAPESADILVTEETSKMNDSSESREGTTLVMNPKTSPKMPGTSPKESPTVPEDDSGLETADTSEAKEHVLVLEVLGLQEYKNIQRIRANSTVKKVKESSRITGILARPQKRDNEASINESRFLPNQEDALFYGELLERDRSDPNPLAFFQDDEAGCWDPIGYEDWIDEHISVLIIPTVQECVHKIITHKIDSVGYTNQVLTLSNFIRRSIRETRMVLDKYAAGLILDIMEKHPDDPAFDPNSELNAAPEYENEIYRVLATLQEWRKRDGNLTIQPTWSTAIKNASLTKFLHEALTFLNYPVDIGRLHDIYERGYGKSLEWKNLGLYRSTAAINVQRQMHEDDEARQVPQVFNVADGMRNNGKREAVTNWNVAWIPIALVDAIKTTQDIPRQHILDDKVIMGILLKIMRKSFHHHI